MSPNVKKKHITSSLEFLISSCSAAISEMITYKIVDTTKSQTNRVDFVQVIEIQDE